MKSLEKTFSKNGPPFVFSQEDLLKNFLVNDTDCPIENLTLVKAENPMQEFSQNYISMSGSEIIVSPKLT